MYSLRIYSSLLFCTLQLSLAVLPTEQVKVAIKTHLEDSCIRAKSSREVLIEKCYWKGNDNYSTNRKVLEKEQTFDVHPADITEHQGVETQDSRSNVPTSFLIRLFKSQKSSTSSSNTATTSCLASISSRLSIEKCQLRKARFLISGSTFQTSSCATTDHALQTDHIRFKICSSGQSCLEFKPTNNGTGRILAFTKETEKFTHLWQFCGENGNCSLSLETLAWSSFIKIKEFQKATQDICQDEKVTTTMTSMTTSANITTEAVEMTTQRDYKNGQQFFNSSADSLPSGTPREISTLFAVIFIPCLSVCIFL